MLAMHSSVDTKDWNFFPDWKVPRAPWARIINYQDASKIPFRFEGQYKQMFLTQPVSILLLNLCSSAWHWTTLDSTGIYSLEVS